MIIANDTSNNNQTTESNIIDIEEDKEITNDIILQDIRRKHVIGGIWLLSLSFIAWSIYKTYNDEYRYVMMKTFDL